MTDISAATPVATLRDFAFEDANLPDANANDLDKDAFLQLLVAQLRYQDPLNPNDPSEFMATTAQFTVVEKLDELTKQGANNAIVTGLSMASSLVGRGVDYIDAEGFEQKAVVSAAQVVNGEVRLLTENGQVEMSSVTGIRDIDAATATEPEAPSAA